MIKPHVACPSVALSSSPPVSCTQYCLPFHCHKVNKQWISGRAAPRKNARCTVQRKSNRVESVISLPETGRGERGRIWGRKAEEENGGNHRQARYGCRIKRVCGWVKKTSLLNQKKEQISGLWKSDACCLFHQDQPSTKVFTIPPSFHRCHVLPLCDWALAAYYPGS